MTFDELIRAIEDPVPPPSADQIAQLEKTLGTSLPEDYRGFLAICNGGSFDSALEYKGSSPTGSAPYVFVVDICGLRDDYSVIKLRQGYTGHRLDDLLPIMGDGSGNHIFLGLSGSHRGLIYFNDHELQPDPRKWDGQIATAKHIFLISGSFREFVAGLTPMPDE